MSMQRWDPFSEMMSLREAMNRLLEDSFVRPGLTATSASYGLLSVLTDLRESEDGFTLEASLPGVKPEDVDISVVGNQVTIQGELKQEQEREKERFHLRERRVGRFQRTVVLPTNVQADKAQAEFKDGILTLTLPKAEEARPRRIQIGQGGQQRIEATSHSGEARQGEQH